MQVEKLVRVHCIEGLWQLWCDCYMWRTLARWIMLVTAQTRTCWPCLPLHSTFCLEFSEQLHCR